MIFILTNSVLLLLHNSHVTVVENRGVELCNNLICLYPLLNEVTQSFFFLPVNSVFDLLHNSQKKAVERVDDGRVEKSLEELVLFSLICDDSIDFNKFILTPWKQTCTKFS